MDDEKQQMASIFFTFLNKHELHHCSSQANKSYNDLKLLILLHHESPTPNICLGYVLSRFKYFLVRYPPFLQNFLPILLSTYTQNRIEVDAIAAAAFGPFLKQAQEENH